MKYKRILLKLSGEAISGKNKNGIDPDILIKFSREIKKIYDSDESGEIIKTSLPKMMKMDDHHMSSFSRNHGYKSTLQCACRHHH